MLAVLSAVTNNFRHSFNFLSFFSFLLIANRNKNISLGEMWEIVEDQIQFVGKKCFQHYFDGENLQFQSQISTFKMSVAKLSHCEWIFHLVKLFL